jgi:hypothetical protein
VVGGLGARLTEMYAWLDENCGADGWTMTRGVVNDAVAIYFLNATSAVAFVSRWCAGSRRKSAMAHSVWAKISRLSAFQPGHTRDVLTATAACVDGGGRPGRPA